MRYKDAPLKGGNIKKMSEPLILSTFVITSSVLIDKMEPYSLNN